MLKLIITALMFFVFTSNTFAGDILSFGLKDESVMTVSEEQPVRIESITNRYNNERWVVRIKLNSDQWDFNAKHVFDEDPSNIDFSMYISHKITKENVLVSAIIPEAIYPNDKFVNPVRGKIKISQYYGKTIFSKFHTGIDFLVKNIPVNSISNGKVVYSGWDRFSSKCNNGGNMIKIAHDNGLYSVYMHLKNLFVKTGDRVKMGQKIAISGNSGKANCNTLGYHLHFEVRTDSNQASNINPRYLLDI